MSISPIVLLLLYIYILIHVTNYLMHLINSNNNREDDEDDTELKKVLMKQCLYTTLMFLGLVIGIIAILFLMCYAYFLTMKYDNVLTLSIALITKWVWDDGKTKNVWICLATSIVFALIAFIVYLRWVQKEIISILLLYIPKSNQGNDDESDTNPDEDKITDITKQKNQMAKIIMMFMGILFFFCLSLATMNSKTKECFLLTGLFIGITIVSIFDFRYKKTIPITLLLIALVSEFLDCI